MLFRDLGLADYQTVWSAMNKFTLDRDDRQTDECWLLEHPPVFTLGQAGKQEHILDAHGIPVIKTDRGGQVTYHAPGQLVAYLLLDLRRRGLGIRDLVDLIEQGIITVLADFGISAHTRKGAPGVYVGEEKIAALGLRVKKGCSYHGLSLNVDNDLAPFGYINPCGYPGLGVTRIRDKAVGSGDLMAITRERLQQTLAASLL